MKKLLVSIGLLSIILAVFLIFASENLTGASSTDPLDKPDLIISVWASKTSPAATAEIEVFAKVKNRGRALADKTTIQLIDTTADIKENLCLLSREKIAELLAEPANRERIRYWNLDLPDLYPSEVYTAQVSTSFIKGKHILTALADADNRIEESAETNNCAQYVIISE